MKRSTGLILFVAAALLGGCLSKPSVVKESFAFAPPPVTNTVPATVPVLAVRKISVAPPFDGLALTYRTGEFSYERDPYAGFLASPAECLAEPVRVWLRNSGMFSVVVEPDSSLKPDLEMDISVEQLYGDFRDRAHPAAVLGMRFIVFEKSRGGRVNVMFQKTYARRVPLQARTAAALVAGWNEALKQILTELPADLKTTVK